MGGDCGTWLPQLHFNWQSRNLNSTRAPLEIGQRNPLSAFINSGTNMAPLDGAVPVYPSSKLPHSWIGQANEPRDWFHYGPHFHQSFTPALNNSIAEGRLPANTYESCRQAFTPNAGSECAQKRLLVVDQSRDQTTLIFTSGIGTPVQCLTSWSPKPSAVCNLDGNELGIKGDSNHFSGPLLTEEFNENPLIDGQSEMHEDTEELNALLYSDNDSDYTEDGEVTSTGHSPCSMTAQDEKDWLEGSTEEVASSAGPTKKRKLFDGVYCGVPSLMDTASSMNANKSSECEDDAESSCANDNNVVSREMGSISGNKRMKRERIRETVNILQSIIPGVSSKDALVVLDQSIHYLKSLKLKAKALGLNAI
ncbi:hypothetical protein I3842_07G170800 [Carya illinoinensis]|uniref:BHLH domain-containing protein n=2 Tax=Carya illinoinensis TaxID=32201 RepID=A0A922JE88_CARIL|nr:hypothetical protein I3842_07G170800 [Carya illinoinensis]